MEFFKCSIAGVDYGIGKTEVERALESKLPNGADGHVGASQVEEDDPAQLAKVEEAREKGFNFWDDRLMEGAWEAQPSRQVRGRGRGGGASGEWLSVALGIGCARGRQGKRRGASGG